MEHLSIDIETYSSINIKKSGLYKYVQSRDFEILLFAYSEDGAAVGVIDFTRGEKLPPEILKALFDPSVIKHAYNASFEWFALCKIFYGFPNFQWLSQWQCTMLHGLYCGFPGGLSAIGEALGLSNDKRKMGVGQALIRTFCSPKKDGHRILPHHQPEKWELFKTYNCQDVAVEMEVERTLAAFPVPESIQEEWRLDQQINAAGVGLNTAMAEGAIDCSNRITDTLMQEAVLLTGLKNPKSVSQLKKWLEKEIGEDIDGINKEKVTELLAADLPHENVRRVLEIRQKLGKSSVSKYTAMMNAVCDDGRIRGLLQFYGANRTGRWAGRLVQVQNLPRNYLTSLGLARNYIECRSIDMLKITFGNVPDTLSQLIRTAFIPRNGNEFVVVDYSAIEARIIAWLAGESWRNEVFATHGKIYEASASQMFHVPMEKIVKGNPEYALRSKGKVAELALGYQGSAGALIKMGALDMGLSEAELPEIVEKWRSASPRICELWHSLDKAAITTLKTGRAVGIKGLVFAWEGDYKTGQDFLTVTLPSGRKLFYVKPFLAPNRFGQMAVHYYGTSQTSKKWVEQETYGGKLTENIVQAIARDCLALTLARLADRGFQTVMHIHDEVVIDCPCELADLDKINGILSKPIPWAEGLFLTSAGFVGDYYMKD